MSLGFLGLESFAKKATNNTIFKKLNVSKHQYKTLKSMQKFCCQRGQRDYPQKLFLNT